jgi:hypothetical protein
MIFRNGPPEKVRASEDEPSQLEADFETELERYKGHLEAFIKMVEEWKPKKKKKKFLKAKKKFKKEAGKLQKQLKQITWEKLKSEGKDPMKILEELENTFAVKEEAKVTKFLPKDDSFGFEADDAMSGGKAKGSFVEPTEEELDAQDAERAAAGKARAAEGTVWDERLAKLARGKKPAPPSKPKPKKLSLDTKQRLAREKYRREKQKKKKKRRAPSAAALARFAAIKEEMKAAKAAAEKAAADAAAAEAEKAKAEEAAEEAKAAAEARKADAAKAFEEKLERDIQTAQREKKPKKRKKRRRKKR